MTFQQYPSKGGIPSGNTAARPTNPVIGDTFYNGQLEILEIWNGTAWVAVSAPPSTPQIISVTDVSTGDVYTSTAGKLQVVFQAGSGGGTPSQYNAFTVSGGHSASSSGTTVTLTGLTPGTSYEVYGNGQNNFGTTVNTPNQAAVTPSTLPEVRTSVTATASTTANAVTVTWTNGSNGGKPLSAITITPFLNGTTAQTARTAATTSSTSYTFEGATALTPESSYTFKVKATNANGTSADSTASNSVTPFDYIPIEALVVAGGGGGGGAGGDSGHGGSGGGGGGGLLYSSQVVSTKNTALTITVGAGGIGAANTSGAVATAGGNSVFIGTAIGGGKGGGSGNISGGDGGSGGGRSFGGSGVAGTATQGNSGGLTGFGFNGGGSGNDSGGGGGGAGAAGQASQGNTQGGAGGAGKTYSISGSSTGYAGGGGGGSYSPSSTTTATDGGGSGGNGNSQGNAGTTNRGGGGGAGAGGGNTGALCTAGRNGGSGVVIIKIADTFSASFSGGVTYSGGSASGGFKTYTVTAAGVSDTVTFS